MSESPAAEERLVRAALANESPHLGGIDEVDLGIAGWRSLVLLDEHLPPGSKWDRRVRGIRRRAFYSTGIATSLALTLCERLADASPVVFGDLALASRSYTRPGDRPVDYLAIHVAGDCDVDHLAGILSSVPGSASLQANRQVVRADFDGMPVGLHRAWPVLMAPASAALDEKPGRVDTPAGTLPIASGRIEALRILGTAGQLGDLCWLLDLAAVAPAAATFSELATLAGRVRRGTAVSASWAIAHRFGIAPEPPTLCDPALARLGQHMAVSSHRVTRAVGNRLLRRV